MKLALLILTVALAVIATAQTCHYTCSSCSGQSYYQCTACNSNRGNGGVPINGMCYCDNSSDQDAMGTCQNSSLFNFRSKLLIVLFISLTGLLSLFAMVVKGMKYFLYKTLEDVQELSLIVFINIYFPQQFDMFLSYLYRFNISSYTFQNIAEGSLYLILPDSSVVATDGQNIYGKYHLLRKTANFFGNQFTWLIVFICLLVTAIIFKIIRNCLKKKKDFVIIKTAINKQGNRLNQSQGQLQQNRSQEWFEVEKREVDQGSCNCFFVVNRVYNILWFNLLIVFFYFSLIQININIFTQIGNLTFSSSFATTGAFFSAAFLSAEIVLLTLLLLKARQQMIKPQWMRDHSYTPTIYLIRTNFKSLTKYFWFISCIKKILLAMMLTLFYSNPFNSIVAVCCVHTLYLVIAIYCQPYQRKYIRAHFYITQGAKLFLFLSLINFTTKYNTTLQLINLTQIFYGLLAFVFGMHFLFLLLSLCVQRSVYKYFMNKKCCSQDYPQQKWQRVGYRSGQKLFIYPKE